MRKIVLTIVVVCLIRTLYGQDQAASVRSQPDTVELKSYATRYDPRKAALYAAVLPGLGQIYNKKYWKLPLVYGGFIGFGYGISFYQKGYTKYKSELFDILETGDDYSTSGFTEDQLRTIVDRYRRERDFFIILMAGMYLLQIVDAHVDAHLKEFDLNPNLHVRLQPTMETDVMTGRTAGFSIKFRF
ncbi:MAG: DUF5683 domain-containing protein [Cyclobacteriaceae bacterium]